MGAKEIGAILDAFLASSPRIGLSTSDFLALYRAEMLAIFSEGRR